MTAFPDESDTLARITAAGGALKAFTIDLGNGAKVELQFGEDGAERPSHRQCGSCALCCRLLPVPPLHKPAGQKCRHQRHAQGGCCTVYQDPQHFPQFCSLWSCRWLVDPTCTVPRPDRAHYVVDVLPDAIEAQGGEVVQRWPVVQVWVDPQYPDAHRDPRLRAWLNEQAKTTGMLAIIRSPGGRSHGLVLAPPAVTGGDWQEVQGQPGAGVGLWDRTRRGSDRRDSASAV